MIPGNQSSSQITMQDFRLPTPFLGYAPIQGEQTFALFFFFTVWDSQFHQVALQFL